jgi:ATPase subunit of ABC transporter with duplicated ATPase domains
MLKVSNLSKRFPDGPVLERVSFVLNAGERVGLVGPNGSGKSTLLKIVAGNLRPDSGSVVLGPSDRVGYLAQYPEDALGLTVAEALAAAVPALNEARREIDASTGLLSRSDLTPDDQDAALARYASAIERFEELGGYDFDHRAEAVRDGLGLGEIEPDRIVATLSGGQKTRLALARLLLSAPTILLLDEPTNYLDLPALLWLERFITECQHGAIIVSHDRRFLDQTVSSIFELDEKTHRLTVYPGTYTDYADAKRREREKQEATYQDQAERIEAFEEQIRALKQKARFTENSTIHFHYRKVAKGVAKRAKTQERRLERYKSEEDRLDRPEDPKRLYLNDLTEAALRDRRLAVSARNLSFAYGDNAILAGVDLEIHGGDRFALIGANGSGKSTLLRALAGDLPAAGEVRHGDGVRVGYLPQEQGADGPAGRRTVLETFRAGVIGHEDEARAFLDKFLFTGDEVHRRVDQLSYGERSKLALAILVASGANVLLLDEPTSHLDVSAVERIESALAEYPGPLLVTSHDRYFLRRVGITGVLMLENGRLRRLDDLDSYEAAVVTGRGVRG